MPRYLKSIVGVSRRRSYCGTTEERPHDLLPLKQVVAQVVAATYQPIASASSVGEVSTRACVRVSAGSSAGGSWYCSVGIGPCEEASGEIRASPVSSSTSLRSSAGVSVRILDEPKSSTAAAVSRLGVLVGS